MRGTAVVDLRDALTGRDSHDAELVSHAVTHNRIPVNPTSTAA
jgi:hypothetical protein